MLSKGLFLVDGSFLVNGNSTDWQIAVTTSANVLYILRYFLQASEKPSLVVKLDHFPLSIDLNAFNSRIPRRTANYHFTQADFDSNVGEHKQLLATPWACAAILQGGIVGHLTKEHLEVDSVMFGPSSSVTGHRLGYTVEVAGITYWDNELSDDELAIIRGLYCCYTGMFNSSYLILSNYI